MTQSALAGQPFNVSSTAADLTALDTRTVYGGQIVHVADVGGGKFAAFYFPTSGVGSQANRRLVVTDQIMTVNHYNGSQSGDLSTVAQDYVVHGATFTAPIGVKRANVSAWANFKCESNLDQQVWMHFKVKRVTGNVTVFDPGARAKLGLASGQHTTTGFVENPSSDTASRTGQLVFIDQELDVFSGEQYIVEVNANKRIALGPTRFVEGLIKIDWRG